MKWLPKLLCEILYHRFGYKNDYCVRCGISLKEACKGGLIISSEYDRQ